MREREGESEGGRGRLSKKREGVSREREREGGEGGGLEIWEVIQHSADTQCMETSGEISNISVKQCKINAEAFLRSLLDS